LLCTTNIGVKTYCLSYESIGSESVQPNISTTSSFSVQSYWFFLTIRHKLAISAFRKQSKSSQIKYLDCQAELGKITARRFSALLKSTLWCRRVSYDSPFQALEKLLEAHDRDVGSKLSQSDVSEAIEFLDFWKLSLEALERASHNVYIPKEVTLKATLSVSSLLRSELQQSQLACSQLSAQLQQRQKESSQLGSELRQNTPPIRRSYAVRPRADGTNKKEKRLWYMFSCCNNDKR
jgi:hypothetical protein